MTHKELKLTGALLYLCEGTKFRKDPRYKNTFYYAIEFTNSNPQLVSLFRKFMIEELRINHREIKAQLFLYPDLDQKKVMYEWSQRTDIPIDQFQKIIVLKAKVSKFKPNPLGTLKIRHTNKEKFLKLQAIMDSVWKNAWIATA